MLAIIAGPGPRRAGQRCAPRRRRCPFPRSVPAWSASAARSSTARRSKSSRRTSSASSRTSIGPQRNLILARLEGGPLAQTGVIAGMSGSPVYIDGRLIGAVSYSLGSFSKEPIAGITPIDEMTAEPAVASRPAPGARARRVPAHARRPDRRVPPGAELESRRLPIGPTTRSWSASAASRASAAAKSATMLRPIATPLVMSGFEPDVADMLGAAFRDQGFVPMGGRRPARGPARCRSTVRSSRATPSASPSSSGDFLLGATGTVTHIDGDRVYAFGHPMYNLGPTEFPMTRAYVYTRPAEPVLVVEAVGHRRSRSARSCRIAPRPSPAGSGRARA